MWAGCLCLCFLAAASSESEMPKYGMVGGEVALEPTFKGRVDKVTWKDGANIAMEWEGTDVVDAYRHFKERGHLNTSTGVMTIQQLTQTDSGTYTPEINGNKLPSIRLEVISPVPKPAVLKTCDEEMTICELTCDGDTTGAGHVTYAWKGDDKQMNTTDSSTATITIDEVNSLGIKVFSCELKNKVSKEISEEIDNPFTNTNNPPNLRISTGLTVCISLLTTVVVLVLIHRWKAGAWFFEKDSMPWQRDFWTEEPKAAAGSNGTTAPQHASETDEETPMN